MRRSRGRRIGVSAIALLSLFFAGVALATVVYPPVKYGQEVTIYFSLYDSNSPWQFYETAPAADDVYIRKDGGAAARATNAVGDLDHVMSLTLTAAEMAAKVVTIDVNDESSPALFGSELIIVLTYGHASALNPMLVDANGYVESNLRAIDGNTADPNLLHELVNDPIDDANFVTLVQSGLTTQGYSTSLATDLGELSLEADYGWRIATEVNEVTSATVFTIDTGPGTDAWIRPRSWLAVVVDADTSLPAPEMVRSYTAATQTVTLEASLPFTPEPNDVIYLMPWGWLRPGGGRIGR